MHNRIQDYKILVKSSHEELEETVIEHLKKGFELHGELAVQSKTDCMIYCQAMILRGDF